MVFSINLIIALLPPLVLTAIILFLLHRGSSKLKANSKPRSLNKSSMLFRALSSAAKPLALFVVFVYIKYIYVILHIAEIKNTLLRFMFEDAFFVASLSLLTWAVFLFIYSFKQQMVEKLTIEERSASDLDNNPRRTKIDALGKLVLGLWLLFAIILVLGHFGVPLGSILAFGGMGSIVIGFAAKDLLGDLMSGFLIYTDGQFDIGEWIKLEDPKLEGTVESIGWRVSRIRTFDDRPLYVPNGLLSKAIIQNVSRREAMRIREHITVGLDSTANISIICKEIRNEVLMNHDGVDQARPIVVNLVSFQAGVCWVYLSCFTRSGDMQGYYGIKQDILVKIYAILATHGVKIESPHVSVHQFFGGS